MPAWSNQSMGVGAIGPGMTGPVLSGVGSSPPVGSPGIGIHGASPTETLGDTVTTLLTELSAADVAKLIDLIGSSLPAQDTSRLQNLVQTFLLAAAENNVAPAMNALSKIIEIDPSHPEILRANPVIEPIRASVEQFLDRNTALAKMDAEGRLEQAGQSVASSAADRLAGWDMRPAAMLTIANRMFDAGGLPNYMHAAQLSQVVIDGSALGSLWVPGMVGVPAETMELSRRRASGALNPAAGFVSESMRRTLAVMRATLRNLWSRAPLLVLLVGWLLVGIMGGLVSMLWRQAWVETWPAYLSSLAFDVWGLGFLVLVGFGFYASVRRAINSRL